MDKNELLAKDKEALETLAAVYALVVCADAKLSESEKVRFDRILETHSLFKELPAELLKFYFADTAEALVDNYKLGKKNILERLKVYGASGHNQKAILSLVRAGVVADSQIKPQENAILEEIERAMGLDAGTL